ncbi:LamG-like jellyroll fold domain-containing protein [Gayadomonas joobiniege]|uniref:LamG-like jellyroll fold domain-containing protein n=1 Tax=Gayadomonas joobiniege TaxID=1234606 RepID=UPI000369ED87|nr:LamG-like jellyroll fold domain-containing protein [Gayadomonas joobiniege]
MAKSIDYLTERVLSGEASKTEIAELLNRLKQDPKLAAQLQTQLAMDELLQQYAASQNSNDHFVENLSEQLPVSQHKDLNFEHKVISQIDKRPPTPWVLTAVSMAASIIMAVLLFWAPEDLQYPSSNEQAFAEVKDIGVAVIANVTGPNSQFQTGDSVAPGLLKVDEGFLELEFYHGAQLKIAAPAELEIINEQRVRLIAGKVMTDVPEVAIGFTIDTPDSEVIDLGTAIGLEVSPEGKSKVHVFDGLIEVKNKDGQSLKLAKGSALNLSQQNAQPESAQSQAFAEFSAIADLTGDKINQLQNRWQNLQQQLLNDPDLLVYYDFQQDRNKPRLLKNLADNPQATNGAIVGANWSSGPWPGKSALEFKRPGDRVRVEINNKFESFTVASWVKIDSLDRTYSSLLLTDGYQAGEFHWQLGNFNNNTSGTIVLGLRAHNGQGRNYNYKPFFTRADSGRWYHLSTTVDQNARLVRHYINGQQVAEHYLKHPSQYYQLGTALIGNWDSQNNASGDPLRNLNGAMAELILLSRALNEEEIKQLALQ